ncbi:MAG: GMC family oxidoreductase N-terminal domain-containing protein [Novipirellula sp. JB048]
MLDFSSLETFSRRDLLKGSLAAGFLPFGFGGEAGHSADPLETIRKKRFSTLVAIIRAQVDSLWGGHQGDDAGEIAREVLIYAAHLPLRLQQGLNVALLWLNLYSLKQTRRALHKLTPQGVRQLLNQGETPCLRGGPPPIRWSDDHLLHTAVGGVAMLGRLVLHSRQNARDWIGAGWSNQCETPAALVSVATPPLADLSRHYDVCIIGSGAGGATVANRLSAAGLHVLILDVGDFISPDALVQKIPQADGSVKLAPPRSDQVLYRLYKDGAAQISGGLGKVKSKLQLAIPSLRKKIPTKQTINVCQARVFGGGPYVNNAIHLPISESVYESWGDRKPSGVDYPEFAQLMSSICHELGVNTEVTQSQISDRSIRFAEGCRALGEEVQPLPVAMRREAHGCGSDNSVDSFGAHIGGIHPYQADQPNSFLVQAMNNPIPAQVAYRTAGKRLRLRRDQAGLLRVDGVDVCHRDASGCPTYGTISANEFVVATGIGETNRLLSHSLSRAGLHNRHLGKRLTANIGTALYAMFDKPIWPSSSTRPEPGVTQCFLVDRRTILENGQLVEEPALENWFHFPGTVALALTGWFDEFAAVMRKFNHLSMSGIVVPTEVRCGNHVDPDGGFHLEFNEEEFEMLLRGLRRIARIYLAAAKPDDGVTLHLPTKALLMRGGRPLRIRNLEDFEWGLNEIRRRGPAFVNLLTTHPQGGAALGDVVHRRTFQMMTSHGEVIENLTVADSSIFPAGCEINPQLTLKALASLAAQHIIQRTAANAAPPTPTLAHS